MAIMGFIVVVAGRVFSDSTSMRIRSQNMLKSAEVSGRVSALVKEDISQMGTKAWGRDTLEKYLVSVAEKVYFEPANPTRDSSSYELHRKSVGDTTFFDSIVFNKAEFNPDGKFLGVRQVSWAARNNGELWRRCRTIEPSSCNGIDTTCTANICPTAANMDNAPGVLIAENLKRFALTPSKPGLPSGASGAGLPDTLFPTSGTPNYGLAGRTASSENNVLNIPSNNITGSGSNIAIKGGFGKPNNKVGDKNFAQVYLVPTSSEVWTNCFEMSFKKGETYSVEFKMPYDINADTAGTYNSTQFLPGVDHIAVGLRNAGGEPIEGTRDVLFYPPQSEDAKQLVRHAEFSLKETRDACIAITFAFYSINKVNSGTMRFGDFVVFRKTDESFHFPKNENYGVGNSGTADLINQKKSVKAFELAMEIEHNGEKVNTYTRSETDGTKSNGMIITTPNNGIISGGSP